MDRFYIGPLSAGKERNLKPFMIADDAFERLNNAYSFRGCIRKRFGERLMVPTAGVVEGYESLVSRLRISVGTTDANGDLTVVIPGSAFLPGANIIKVGAQLSCGTEIFTVTSLGTPTTLLTTGASTTHTLNTTTGDLVLVGSTPSTAVYFYPCEPVMALLNYEIDSINDEPLYAFDTRFAYKYDTTGWVRLGTAVYTGTNADFFWGENHRGVTASEDCLFVTNNVEADGIRWYSTATPAGTRMAPVVDAGGTTVESCKIIISFKNRLVFLSTKEKTGAVTTTFQSRCRFSQNGTPIITSDALAWREDIPGKGGWIDLPCQEAIITAQHLRDRVIVYCERSTWELAYTGNQILPFVWQQINTELGAESTFSQVPFDSVVLGVGQTGIFACDGVSVQRIDEKIPDEVFDIHNTDAGLNRVAGIRDYVSEQVYWTLPSKDRTSVTVYPDQLLVYNYATKTWATFDDTITAWGYVQEGTRPVTWASLIGLTWAEWHTPWNQIGNSISYRPKNRNVVAGNQQGFVFIVDQEKSTLCPSTAITNITSPAFDSISLIVKDHNLKVGDYVLVENCHGCTELNDQIVRVEAVGATANEVTLYYPGNVTGTYTGGGTLTKISRIDILTKQYNFYSDEAKNMALYKIDFNVDRTENGLITVDYSTSSTRLMMSEESVATNCDLGEPVLETYPYALYPLEAQQERLWHSMYFQAEGECIQLRLYFTDQQMLLPSIHEDDFQLNGMILTCEPRGRI